MLTFLCVYLYIEKWYTLYQGLTVGGFYDYGH